MTKRKPRLHEEDEGAAVATMDGKQQIKDKKIREVSDDGKPVCKKEVCIEGNGGNGANGGNGGNGENGGGGGNGDSEIKLSTIPADPRWPNQNVTNYCFMMYVDYHRCIRKRGDDYEPCQYFQKVYKGLCPVEWVERFDSLMAAGTFPRKFDPK